MRTKLAPTLALLLVASLADAQRLSVRPNLGRAIEAIAAAETPQGPQVTARAQADTSGLAQFESVVEFQPRSPNYKVSFSLEDADLGELVRVIGQLTGKRFIFGGKVRNIKTSVLCPEKVTVAEAYQAFLSILETNGLTIVPQGRFFKIIDSAGVGTQLTPVYRMGENVPTEDRFVTRLHRLSHVGADEVANVLGHFKSKDADITIHGPGNLLILTDTGANIRRMMQIVEEIDVGGAGDQIWIEPVHYGAASDLATRITDLFDLKAGQQPGAPKPGAGATSDVHVSKVVADDRSNSLIIVATERAYLRILEFLKRVDLPPTGEGEIHVVPLQHADATEIVKTLQDVIQGAGGGGGGAPQGQKAQTAVFEGNIKVSADKATNSLVITSSPRDYANIRAVLDKLDRARRQVFIELVVMDLTLNRKDTYGVKYHGGDTVAMSQGDGIALGGFDIGKSLMLDPNSMQGLALGIRGPDLPGSANRLLPGVSIPAFGVALNAIATTTDADILSTPHILATDNIPAEINVGSNIPLQQNIIPAFGGFGMPGGAGGAATGASALGGMGALGMAGMGMGMGMGGMGGMRQDVGTKIKIVPHLNESNEVRLELTEEISDVAGEAVGNAGQVPLSKRTANTTLVVKDQQTVVIGGLMRNRVSRSESKVPLLGDLPVLGGLFRTSTKGVEKTNLVLVLTPHVIREQSDLRAIFERKMHERQEFLDRYFVFAPESQYDPPRDYARTNGLVEDMRQHDRELEQKAKLDELLRPKEIKVHTPGSPIEPAAPTSKGGAAASPVTGAPAPAAPVMFPPGPEGPPTGKLPPIKMPRVDMGPALRGIRDAQQSAPPQP
jgi:general secretion pathway protein D